MFDFYSKLGNLVLGGDFNAKISSHAENGYSKTAMLSNFIDRNTLTSLQQLYGMSAWFTYTPNKTSIDHRIVENAYKHLYTSFSILDEREIMTSDHLPLLFSVKKNSFTPSIISPRKTIDWQKCNDHHISAYKSEIDRGATKILCEENNIEFTPDFVNKEIVNIILNASATLPKSNFNKNAKPHWSAKV